MDELLVSLQDAKMFPTIDLVNGYYQLSVHVDKRGVTAAGILPDQEHINFILKAFPLLDAATLRSSLASVWLIGNAHERYQDTVHIKKPLPDRYWWPKIDSQVLNQVVHSLMHKSNDKTASIDPTATCPKFRKATEESWS